MKQKSKEINTFANPPFRFLTIVNNQVYFMLDGCRVRFIFSFIRCWKENENHRHTFRHHYIIFIIANIENNISDVYVTNDEDQGEMTTKEFRDPIYHFVHVNPYELEIIDSESFQRLRYIHQLGLTFLTYPGAEHKRFEHSLGVTEIASKLFDILKEKDEERFYSIFPKDELEKYKQTLRIASLLHDIGHFPFSHASEDIWLQGHEKYSSDMVLSEPIKNLIEENCPSHLDIKAKDISFIISKKPETRNPRFQLLRDIITGELGVDRIDYLVRDSLHTGVLYGVFDYHRLLDTFMVYPSQDVDRNPMLYLERGGIHAAEGLIVARYFMFTQVYYHKTRSVHDCHLRDYLKEFLSNSKDRDKDYTELENFTELNDIFILNQMREDIKSNNKRSKLAKLILSRNHHQLACEVDGNALLQGNNTKKIYDEFEKKVTMSFSDEVQNGEILFDTPNKKTNKFTEADFYVFREKDDIRHILIESELIAKLNKIDLFRVYVARGEDGMGKKIKKIIEKSKQTYVRRG